MSGVPLRPCPLHFGLKYQLRANSVELCKTSPSKGVWGSPLALDGAELVTFGEAEWLELRLEVDGLGCMWDDNNNYITI